MALVRTIAGRSLSQRPGRTVFSILGIAIGIVTVVGVFTLDHNTVVGMSRRSLDEWRPELEVQADAAMQDPRGALESTPGVAGVSAMFQNDVAVRVTGGAGVSGSPERGGGRPGPRDAGPRDAGPRDRSSAGDGGPRAQVRLFALDAASLEPIGAVLLAEGRSLDPAAREPEVLIGAPLAEELGVGVGGRIALARPARAPRQDCVDGVLRTVDDAPLDVPPEIEFSVVGVLLRERLGRRSQGQVVVVDYPRGRELFEGVHVEPRYWVRQGSDVDIERLRSSLGRSFSYELNKSVIVGAAADERAFRNGVRMAGLLALVLGLYVIFHTLSMSLVERVREVGTLHALGATRSQIARIFLLEAAVIAGAAGVLGLGGGILLARILLGLGITTLGTGHWFKTFEVPWVAALTLTLLGVGIALAGSVYPLLRAREASTVGALRGEATLQHTGFARGFHVFAAVLLVVLLPALYFVIVPVVGAVQGALVGTVLLGVGFLALLVVLPLVVPSLLGVVCIRLTRPFERLSPLAGQLASRAMRDSPARVAVSSAAIALVAASFVGLKGMTASLRGEVESWADRAMVDKVWVKNLPNLPLRELEAALASYPGVIGVESGTLRTYVPFLLLGLEPKELAGYGPCRDDPALARALEDGTGVILSRRLARHLEYALGDQVHVGTASGVRDLTVVAISDDYGYFPQPDERLYGVTGAAFMEKAFCFDGGIASQIAVRLERGADPGVVEAAIGERWPGTRLEVLAGRGLLGVHLRDIDRDFFLFDIILGLTALLAGLGVLNGQLLSALERSKEIGVLKALGVSRGQVAGTVLLESAVVGLLGGALGTALGAGLTPVIVQALSVLSGLDLPERLSIESLCLVPLGAVLLTLVAGLYPIWRMNRLDAVAAVRTG